MLRLRLIAALAASSVVLVGCGSDPEPKTASSSDPGSEAPAPDGAGGTEIAGEGFTFNAPEGWREDDGSNVPSIAFLALAVDPDDADGFADNVSVIEDPTVVDIDAEQLQDALENVLERVADDVRFGDPIEIDGEPAAVVLATYDTAPGYRTMQHVVSHDGSGYVVTYSFSDDVSEDDQRALAESVAATWSWDS